MEVYFQSMKNYDLFIRKKGLTSLSQTQSVDVPLYFIDTHFDTSTTDSL